MVNDLESCYDRQLPKIGGVVEGSVGVNREAIQLFSKSLHRSKYCARTSHEISEHMCRGDSFVLGRKGQGNELSGYVRRDFLFLMFK